MNKSTVNKKTITSLFVIIELIIYYFIFIKEKVINMDIISNAILIVILLINILYFCIRTRNKLGYNKKEYSLLILLNMLISFFICGKQLFLTNKVVDISFYNIFKYALINFLIYPIICNLLYYIDKLNLTKSLYMRKRSKKQIVLFSLSIFFLFFITWMCAAYSFFPGNYMTDSIAEYQEAIGDLDISLARPALHTILIRYLLRIWSNPFIIIIVEILLFSLVLSFIYTYLYSKNLNCKILIISAILFAIFPNNIKLITFFLTDVTFSIGMLLLTFELYRVSTKKEGYFKKWYNILILIISLLMVNYSRLNGIIPYIITIVYLLYLIFRIDTKKQIIMTIVLLLSISWIIKNPIYNHYNIVVDGVNDIGASSFATKGLGALVYYDGNLTKNEKSEITRILPEDKLKKYYSPYNIDTYTWSEMRKEFHDGVIELGTKEIYKIYIINIFKNPDIIIRDRMDGANLLWSYDTPKDGFLYSNEYGIAHHCNLHDDVKIKKSNCDILYNHPKNNVNIFIKNYQKFIEKIKVLFILSWRPGVVISIFLIILFYSLIKGINIIPTSLPTIINILFWSLLMNHPSYRYMWFIFIDVYFIFLLMLLQKISNSKVNK